MIKLYVNYTELEIGQDTQNILATFSINDVAGVAERRGSITQEMFLPATPVNSQTLASCPASGYVASIESNGIVCFTGKLRVSKTEYLRGGVVGYSCTMYGDNLDFAYLLNRKQLREVVTNTFVHDKATIETGVADQVLFPLVNYGKWDVVSQVDIMELRPAVSMKYTIEKIFEGIGYGVQSSFLSDNQIRKLHTLFTCGDYVPAASFLQQNSFRAERTTLDTSTYSAGGYARLRFDDDTTPPNYDPSGSYDTGVYEWRTPLSGMYDFTVIIKSTDVVRPTDVELRDTLFNPINSLSLISDDGTYLTFQGAPIFLYQYDGFVNLPIEFWAYKSGSSGVTYNFEATTFIEVKRSAILYEGDEVNVSDCLPKEITQLQYLKGIIHAFNLYLYADVALRQIYIEPRNAWVSPDTGNLVDGFLPNTSIFSINDIVETGDKLTISTFDNLNESVRFTYKEGDNYVKQIEAGTNNELYAAAWNMQTESIQKQTVSDNPAFGRFSLLADNVLPLSGDRFTIVMPRLWNADWESGNDYPTKSYEFPPMLAVIEEVSDCNTWQLNFYGGTADYSYYFYAFMFDFPRIVPDSFSIAYGNQLNIFGDTITGLVQRFYLREQVCKRGGEVLKLRAVVSAWLINYLNNIRYRTFFEYSGNIYSIQEIRNFVIGEDSICEITLLLERFASESDVNNIESNNLNCLNNVS